MYISNKAYDILKALATTWLPALVVLISALTITWNIPYGQPIAATVAAINTFIGAGLGISSKNYTELNTLEENYTDVRVDEVVENEENK